MKTSDLAAVERLAMSHTAASLVAAAAARSAAQLVHQHQGDIPAAVITQAVASYESMLRSAIGSTARRRHKEEC